MDKNKNCTLCNMKLDINNYKKDRTICKDCYNKNRRTKAKTSRRCEKLFESVSRDITNSFYENNIITLESLNIKINDVLELLEVIKSRLPKTTRITIT